MGKHIEVFVGLDVAKAKNAVAIAEGERNGEVRYLGEIENTAEATRRLIAKLSRTYGKMTFCYEAGPTGPHGIAHVCRGLWRCWPAADRHLRASILLSERQC